MPRARWAGMGRGTDEHFGVDTNDVDIWTGSLAKAIPSNGGFVAGSQQLMHLSAACLGAVYLFRRHGRAGDCGGERGAGGAEG